MVAKAQQKGKRRFVFSEVMQTRVPPEVRETVQKELDRLYKSGVYKSESDWIRDAILDKIKEQKLK